MSQVVDAYIEVGRKKCVMEARSGQYEPGMGRGNKVITGPEKSNYSRIGGRKSNKEP
jgi:hypothetical protein